MEQNERILLACRDEIFAFLKKNQDECARFFFIFFFSVFIEKEFCLFQMLFAFNDTLEWNKMDPGQVIVLALYRKRIC